MNETASMIRLIKTRCHNLVVFIVSSLFVVQRNIFNLRLHVLFFPVCTFVTLGDPWKKTHCVFLLHGHALIGTESIVRLPMIHLVPQPLPIDEGQVRTPEYMRWIGEFLQ